MRNQAANTRICKRIPPNPTIGVVIGTYGSACYIALQLEACKRYWPNAAVLVHDDSSEERDVLQALCDRYGVEFVSTPERLGHGLGDLASVVAGIEWARKRNLDLVVKMSRRFLILKEWTAALAELAHNTQYSSYTNACSDFKLPFRSECAAFHVDAWDGSTSLQEIRSALAKRRAPAKSLERWFQTAAMRVHNETAPTSLRVREAHFPPTRSMAGYGVWHLLGGGRKSHVPGVLWHDVDLPEAYHDLAVEWGLQEYSLDNFRSASSYAHLSGRLTDKVRPEAAADHVAVTLTKLSPLLQNLPLHLRRVEVSNSIGRYKQIIARRDPIQPVFDARIARTLGREPFDLLVGARTVSGIGGNIVAVRSYYDSPVFVNLRSKASVEEALISSRSDDILRFIARRAADCAGLLLAIGTPVPGLAAVLGRVVPERVFVAVENDAQHAEAAAASESVVGNENAVFLVTDTNLSEHDSIAAVPTLRWPSIGVLIVNVPGSSAIALQSLAPFIKRDHPEIVFYAQHGQPLKANQAVDAPDQIEDVLAAHGYTMRSVSNDGTMYPFPSRKDRHPQAVYASYGGGVGQAT